MIYTEMSEIVCINGVTAEVFARDWSTPIRWNSMKGAIKPLKFECRDKFLCVL